MTTTAIQESEQTIEIPPNVLVGCPMANGRLVRLEKCTACPNWRGLGDRFGDGSAHPFAVRYLLQCAHPRNLGLVELEP